MTFLLETAFNYLLVIAEKIDYIKAGFIICLVSVLLSSFSVSVKTAVYGYPKVSGTILFTYFIIALAVYLFAVIDCLYGDKYFENLGYAFIYLVVLICSITGLYAVFYRFAEKNYNKKEKRKKELCVAFSRALATVEEVDLDIKKSAHADTEDCFDNEFFGENETKDIYKREIEPRKNTKTYFQTLKLKTEKLGGKKPRHDDNINYAKAIAYFDELLKEDLSPIEKATLKVLSGKIKKYKTVEFSDQIRAELSDAFSSYIKIRAKADRRKENMRHI